MMQVVVARKHQATTLHQGREGKASASSRTEVLVARLPEPAHGTRMVWSSSHDLGLGDGERFFDRVAAVRYDVVVDFDNPAFAVPRDCGVEGLHLVERVHSHV